MKDKFPVTLATRYLDSKKIQYDKLLYKYEEHGGTSVSARELNVDEHNVIKTLIMEDERSNPFIVLMHGDMTVSQKELARILNVKTVSNCNPATADKHSGYMVGGTSPFGVKRQMTAYIEESIMGLDIIYINGGKRGFLLSMSPLVLSQTLDHRTVQIGLK